MHNSGGQFLLLVILVGLSAGTLARTVTRARAAHRGTPASRRSASRRMPGREPEPSRRPASRRVSLRMPGSGWLEHRRKIRLEELKHKHGLLRDWARHRMRMREREAAAPKTAATPPGSGATTGPGTSGAGTAAGEPRRRTVVSHVVSPGRDQPAGRKAPADPSAPAGAPVPSAAPPQPGNTHTTGGNSMGTKYTTVGPGGDGSPGRSPYGPPLPFLGGDRNPVTGQAAATAPRTGGNIMATAAGGAVEQAVNGMHSIHAHAAAGGIRAKQAAVKACAEIFIRLSGLLLMLSRTIAERGYGPEIFEPLAQAAVFAQAAGLACGQSDAALESLANMKLGELADSPRQAPHREELSESGSR